MLKPGGGAWRKYSVHHGGGRMNWRPGTVEGRMTGKMTRRSGRRKVKRQGDERLSVIPENNKQIVARSSQPWHGLTPTYRRFT